MSEKRFKVNYEKFTENEYLPCGLIDMGENSHIYKIEDVCELLNEQQATIQRMKHSLNTIYKAFEKHYGYDMRNAVWLIDELSYDEIVDELYIAETDSKNRKEASMYWKKKFDEQQATIRKLQDLCGESDGENAKLRIENKRLQEENEQLQKKIRVLSAHLLSDECCLTDSQIRKIRKELEE